MEKKSASEQQQPWMEVTEIDIIYRNKLKAKDRPRVDTNEELYRLVKSVWNMDTIGIREEFKVIFMNHGNRVLGLMNLSIGGMTGTNVDIRLILAAALKVAATRIALAHNHPSGTLTPSRADIHLTQRIKQACCILDIDLLAHIILSGDDDSFYAMSLVGEF